MSPTVKIDFSLFDAVQMADVALRTAMKQHTGKLSHPDVRAALADMLDIEDAWHAELRRASAGALAGKRYDA